MAARHSIDMDLDPRSIIATRVFDAPRDLVFSELTDQMGNARREKRA